MRAFKYSLENVLEFRKNLEEEEKQKFAQVQNEYLRQKNILRAYEEKLDAALTSQVSNKRGKVYELKSRQQYINFLQEKIEFQEQVVMRAEEAMESRRQQLISAQKDRKMIEKHKEKALIRYNFDMDQMEQKTIDELALYSHMRK